MTYNLHCIDARGKYKYLPVNLSLEEAEVFLKRWFGNKPQTAIENDNMIAYTFATGEVVFLQSPTTLNDIYEGRWIGDVE